MLSRKQQVVLNPLWRYRRSTNLWVSKRNKSVDRDAILDSLATGNKVVDFTQNGQLVPDDIVFQVVASKLNDPENANGVLFDGFPRTIPQAEMLVDWLSKNNRKVDGLFNISVSDKEVRRRLVNRRTCLDCGQSYHLIFKPSSKEGVCDACNGGKVVQRSDDTLDKVNGRLLDYHKSTQPILEHLSKITQIIHFDGESDIETISSTITNQLREWVASKS